MPAIFVFNSPGAGTPAVSTTTFLMGPGVSVQDFVAMGAVADTVVRGNADAYATGLAIGLVRTINDPLPGQCQVQLGRVTATGFAGLVTGDT